MIKRIDRFVIPLAVAVLTALTCPGAEPKDYREKKLPNANFANELLSRAKFDSAILESADFANAVLKDASFQNADLRKASFRKALLDGADFSGAKLQGADFSDAKAWKANFSKTVIHLLGDSPEAAKQARETGTGASNGSLSFRDSDMRDAVIMGDAYGVDFRYTDLRGANLSSVANLGNAYFKGAKYNEATRWSLDPEKAGAVLVKTETPKNEKIADAKNSPFVGTWRIYHTINEPATRGEIQFSADHTCTWKPLASETKILNAKWTATKEDQITISDGELGKTWNVRRIEADGKSSLELKTSDGESRIAFPRSSK